MPNSPYAASKAAADMPVRAATIHTLGMPTLITRCSNNYGPYQFPEKLIPLFISNLSRDESVPVYGDGLQVRDWIHVRDHCAGIDRVWQAGRVGEVYNLGGRCEKTNLELTQQLLAALGKPTSLIRYVQATAPVTIAAMPSIAPRPSANWNGGRWCPSTDGLRADRGVVSRKRRLGIESAPANT